MAKNKRELTQILLCMVMVGICLVQSFSSCANQGYPSGGSKDTIPPILVESDPPPREIEFRKKEVVLKFNEFIVLKDVSTEFNISPPVKKRPVVRKVGKRVFVEFKDNLKENTTYSLSFGHAIRDFTEGNPTENLFHFFSTGKTLDSLVLCGYVYDAFTLKPEQNMLLTAYSTPDPSFLKDSLPEYITRSNKEGFFLFVGLPPKSFYIRAIQDADGSMTFSNPTEKIAYSEQPFTTFYPDSLNLSDSVLAILQPQSLSLWTFKEKMKKKRQRISTIERKSKEQIHVGFEIPFDTVPNFRVLYRELGDTSWYFQSGSQKKDSVILWLTHAPLVKQDTLWIETIYASVDSNDAPIKEVDTSQLIYRIFEKKIRNKKKRRSDSLAKILFKITSKTSSTQELNQDLLLSFPEPLGDYADTAVKLFRMKDTLPLLLSDYRVRRDSLNFNSIRVSYTWKSAEKYLLRIDSNTMRSVLNRHNDLLELKFKARDIEEYGQILANITGIKAEKAILQLSTSPEFSALERSAIIPIPSKHTFSFLLPKKYYLRLIWDNDKNGEWSTGNLMDSIQPEKIYYLEEPQEVRSNWDIEVNWELIETLTPRKPIKK